MYVSEIYLRNIGPINEIKITPRFDSDGKPLPILLVGQNGSGKSLTLSVVLDTLIEARKKKYQSIPEVDHDKYMRLLSKSYINVDSKYSIALVSLSNDDSSFVQHEVLSKLSGDELRQSLSEIQIGSRVIPENNKFIENGFYKNTETSGAYLDAIGGSVFLYLPYFRYELPAWMNGDVAAKFSMKEFYFGYAQESIVKAGIISEISNWLLDLVLDQEIYERKTIVMPVDLGGQVINTQVLLGYIGTNTQTIRLVNKVLTEIYKAKDQSIDFARFGIGKKNNRHISIYCTKNGVEQEMSPRLNQLSSGELMTLSLFCSIIKAYDSVKEHPPNELSDIVGIVVIDEIDLHLHIAFQRNVLPNIVRMFPKIQFIITTHSPFFLIGMAEAGADGFDIYSLPTGTRISADEFSEFATAYDTFIKKDQQFRFGYENLVEQIAREKRPLIVTEGKTDWKHLKSALTKLKGQGFYNSLDVDFLEFGDDVAMGDTFLLGMCESFSRVQQPRQIIFVFDRDVPNILKAASGGGRVIILRGGGSGIPSFFTSGCLSMTCSTTSIIKCRPIGCCSHRKATERRNHKALMAVTACCPLSGRALISLQEK